MQGYNLLVIFSEDMQTVLMCKRKRAPYQGLSNFPGGKIEKGEDGLHAAYRELQEETAITEADVHLTHFMDFTYHSFDLYLEVYVGRLRRTVHARGTENDLYWSALDHDFFDESQYAGEGKIGHILREIELYQDKIPL